MSQCVHCDACAEIKKFSAICVPDPATTSMREYERRTCVDRKEVFIPERYSVLGRSRLCIYRKVIYRLQVACAGGCGKLHLFTFANRSYKT